MTESVRILVVDDEDSVRKRCVRLLARHGYDVVGARDSKAALNIVQTTSCDVMLVDIRMPGMDGSGASQTGEGIFPFHRGDHDDRIRCGGDRCESHEMRSL